MEIFKKTSDGTSMDETREGLGGLLNFPKALAYRNSCERHGLIALYSAIWVLCWSIFPSSFR